MIAIFAFWRVEEYNFRAKSWGKRSNHTQLLLSYIELHSPVKTCTFSRWTCQILKYAGINTKMFKPHLEAKILGISPTQIQQAESYIIKRYFQKQPLLNQFWRWKDSEEGPLLETCVIRSGGFRMRSTEILWNKIENCNKEWSKYYIWSKTIAQQTIYF